MPLSAEENPKNDPCVYCSKEHEDDPNLSVEPSLAQCIRCRAPFCIGHSSPIDPLCCNVCVPVSSTELKELPLIGEDGVTHKGRHLVPVGTSYRTLPRAIADMSDEELAGYISKVSAEIHEVEKAQDYRRIALSTATLEVEERDGAKKRALRGTRVTSTGVRRIVSGSKTKGQPNGVVQNLTAALPPGVNLADFLKFAGPALAKIRAAKGKPVSGTDAKTATQAEQRDIPPSGVPKPVPIPDPREAEIESLFDGDDPITGVKP